MWTLFRQNTNGSNDPVAIVSKDDVLEALDALYDRVYDYNRLGFWVAYTGGGYRITRHDRGYDSVLFVKELVSA